MADVALDLSVFTKMRVAYDGYEYSPTDFDLQSLKLISECLSGSENGVAVYTPVPTALFVLCCIALPAMVLDRSLKIRSKSTYQDLQKGDLVKLRGLLGQYIGVKDGLIYIRFADGLLYGMPPNMGWTLTKYTGQRKRLSKFNRKARRDGSRELAVLQRILGLEDDKLPPFFASKVIIVADKRETHEHLMKVTIDGCGWSSVFPSRYYAKEGKGTSFGLDPLSRKPVVLFTSKLDVAVALNKNEKADVIAVMDPRRLGGYYVDLEREIRGGTSVAVLGDSKRWDRKDIEQLRASGFRVFVWNSANARPHAIIRSRVTQDTVLHRSERVVRNLARARWSLIEVPAGGCAGLDRIRRLLADVARHSRSEDLDRFIIVARQLLLSIACLPIPRNHCVQLRSRDEGLLGSLRDFGIRARVTVSDRASAVIDETIRLAEGALRSCHDQHPKAEKLLERAALLADDGCVIARTTEDQSLMSEWLKAHGVWARVQRIDEAFRSSMLGDSVLLPGWWGRPQTRFDYSGLYSNHEVIVFPYEREWRVEQLRHEARFLGGLSISTKPSIVSEAARFDDLDEIIARVSSRVYESTMSTLDAMGETEAIVSATPVRFGNDYYALLTPRHRCRCIDFDTDRIVVKTPSELQPGDVLVFVKDSADDIFDRLVAAAREVGPTMAETVRLAGLWKTALLETLTGGTSDPRTIQARLSKVGVIRSTAAIRRWLTDEDTIGPEDDAIRAIAKFTGHAELRARLEDVLSACRRLRALHVRLGRYLATAIVSSVVGEESDTEDGVLASIVQDLSEHAEAVTVLSVAPEMVDVPVSKANRLIDINM